MGKHIFEDFYPLSPMQEGLLFRNLYQASDEYLVQSVFELEGEIENESLKKAWQAIMDHYPVLRTGFIWEDLNKSHQYVCKFASAESTPTV